MKTSLRKNLVFALATLTVGFSLSAFADGDPGSQAVVGSDGNQSSATVSPKNADPASCVGCKNARAAADVGGTIASTPGEFAPNGSGAKNTGSGATAQ